MPFRIIRNDLVKMNTDVIVNTANPRPVIGRGTDSAIYNAAGKELLLRERKKIGNIERGDAFITPGFGLQAKFIIHTVGPVWRGGDHGEEETLRSCYEKSLLLAKENNCESIAFPLISTGVYGFPKDLALQIVIKTVSNFLLTEDMLVYLVVFDEKSTRLSGRIFQNIESKITNEYVRAKRMEEYESDGSREWRRRDRISYPSRASDYEEYDESASADVEFRSRSGFGKPQHSDYAINSCRQPAAEKSPSSIKKPEVFGKKKPGLDDLIERSGETFQQMLLRLIKEKGLTNAQAYKKSNQDKKLFSKIKNDEKYQPKKKTAMAFAIGLELNLDQATDLLQRAGYAFSPANKFDIAMKYFIKNQMYNITEIECILFELGLDTLCNYD